MYISKSSLVLVFAGMALAGCSTIPSANDRLVEQSTLGVNWIQQAGEYDAIALQTYQQAKQAFRQVRAKKGMKKAVVVDLDETVLDNSAYAGWQVKNKKAFSSKTWTQWVNAKQATAIAGSKDFINYVNSHGGTVLFVSNRKADVEQQATIENMKKLGYSGLQPNRFYLKKDTSNKQPRLDAIKGKGYDIVIYIGDNLNDFGGETYHKNNKARQDFVKHNRALFGKKYFVLPNPNYGDWIPGMTKGYWGLSKEQKLKAHDKAINAWNGQ